MITEYVAKDEEAPITSLLSQKTVAEFFAGIGLMRIGLERQGWSVVFANDFASDKRDIYAAHFSDAASHLVEDDVHLLAVNKVPQVTLATASFPCNDLSIAGAREGLYGKESSAFWGFMRVIKDMYSRKPPLILLENVTGFLTSHQGADFKKALLALNELGYSVDVLILDAARFVPQSRQRLFIVGTLCNAYAVKASCAPLSFYESDVRPKALAHFILNHPEIQWNIRELSPLPHSTTTLATILEDLPDTAPEWWSKERAEYLINQMSE